MNLITVEQADQIILAQTRDYGVELVPFEQALGRFLAENLEADRDLPPFNRATMDGIAINYRAIENKITVFHIKATQAAGDEPINIEHDGECIEIMTGAALPAMLDTVIRYEDLEIKNGTAQLLVAGIQKGQSIHIQGADKKQGEVMVAPGQVISPAIIGIAASIGKTELTVKKIPRVTVISSGDELVEVADLPSPYQIRKSNGYTIKAVLQQHGLDATMLHIPDDAANTRKEIEKGLANFDVILLSGGVSMGKFDYIPKALEEAGVQKLFHKVQQRPGKPFWFGTHQSGAHIFAFPGNPVATFMCLHRYFLKWFYHNNGIKRQSQYAKLGSNFVFEPHLQYFLQVKLFMNEQAHLIATPVEGNGSGDFANLADTDAFLELPLEKSNFKKGQVYPVYIF